MNTKPIYRHLFTGRIVSPAYAEANPRLVKMETVPTKKADRAPRIVQVRNPRTGTYSVIDREAGRFTAQRLAVYDLSE